MTYARASSLTNNFASAHAAVNSAPGATNIIARTILAGEHKELPSIAVALSASGLALTENNHAHELSWEEVFYVCKKIDELYSENPRQALDSALLVDKYGRFENFPYNYFKNGQAIQKTERLSYACNLCGVVLPKRLIEVDHRIIKNDGHDRAIAKVLRQLNLTSFGPKKNYFKTVIATSARIPYYYASGEGGDPARNASGTDKKSNRYTLNWSGVLFYSACCAELEIRECLKERCMNSIVNLRPLCGACNKARPKVSEPFPSEDWSGKNPNWNLTAPTVIR